MSVTQVRNWLDERASVVNDLQAHIGGYGTDGPTAEQTQAEERMQRRIDDLMDFANNELADLERTDQADEARRRLENLENGNGDGAEEDAAARALQADHRKIVNLLEGRSSREVFGAPERRDLLAGTATDGAELVPTTLYGRLHEHLVEQSSVMQANATVIRSAGGEQIDIPKTTAYSTATIVGEAGTIGESDPQFDTVSLEAYNYAFLTQVSKQLLTDSVFDVVDFVSRQGGAALGRGIGAHLVSGTGSGQPNGVDNVTTGATTTGATAITASELIDLQHSVLRPYRTRAVWIMNDSVLAYIRKLQDADNNFLWRAGLTAGEPDTLLGAPVYTDPNMNGAITTGLTTAVYGDMSGYYARMAGGIEIERSDHYAFANALTTFRFMQRADGDIVDTVGIRKLVQA